MTVLLKTMQAAVTLMFTLPLVSEAINRRVVSELVHPHLWVSAFCMCVFMLSGFYDTIQLNLVLSF